MRIPVAADIEAAYRKIKPYVHKTPVLRSSALNKIFGSELYFKCENFQKVGAFKFRGAINAVLSLKDDEVARGLITHSSGNHAAALSLAAGIRGVKAYIVMPSNSPAVKKKAVAGYGAEIRFCEPNLKARVDTATEIINETGAVFIHAYDNFDVICGQGSAGLELVNEYPDLDIVIGPVGGGGLMSGTAIAVKGEKPGIRVFGAEPLGADDAYRSIKSGVYVSDHVPDTIADGLLTTLSKRTFAILSEMLDDIFTVSDESIINSMRLLWERMKIIVEPSSAVSLAVIGENPEVFKNRKVGIILSGGNVDLDNLPFSR
ncbi:MAG TPA: pyridoxal-phosphate dependent enzyme [Desulfobacteraceae bacterium]|nr:pyridoxal-phosphate dependent enzyme [Desulfobacteraceae bacterium]